MEMPRLIDADALYEVYNKRFRKLMGWPVYHREFLIEADHIKECMEKLNAAPTIEAEPVRKGEWRHRKGEWPHCNKCHYDAEYNERTTTGYNLSNYCPYCGALMGKEQDNAAKPTQADIEAARNERSK